MTDHAATQVWSSCTDRGQWKQEAAAAIKPLAEAKHAQYIKHYLDNPQEQEALDAFFEPAALDAEMYQRCDGDAKNEPYASHTEGPV